jgi:hypothetical protein
MSGIKRGSKSPWRNSMVRKLPTTKAIEENPSTTTTQGVGDETSTRTAAQRPIVKHHPAPPRDGVDATFAAMARYPNPVPQPWFDNPTALPKKPPGKNAG